MSKDKKKDKKNKKNQPFPPLDYSLEEIENLARTIIAINPHMRNRTVDEMTKTIIEVVKRCHENRCWFVSTAGWTAILDVWEENTFVDFTVNADMVHSKLRKHVGGFDPAQPRIPRDEL